MDPDQPLHTGPPIPAKYSEPSASLPAGVLIFGSVVFALAGWYACIWFIVALGQRSLGPADVLFRVVLCVIMLACLSGAGLCSYLVVRDLVRGIRNNR